MIKGFQRKLCLSVEHCIADLEAWVTLSGSCSASLDGTTVAHPLCRVMCHVLTHRVCRQLCMGYVVVFPVEWKVVERESSARTAFDDECHTIKGADECVQERRIPGSGLGWIVDGWRLGGWWLSDVIRQCVIVAHCVSPTLLDSLPHGCFDRKSLYPVFIDSLNNFATDSLHHQLYLWFISSFSHQQCPKSFPQFLWKKSRKKEKKKAPEKLTWIEFCKSCH